MKTLQINPLSIFAFLLVISLFSSCQNGAKEVSESSASSLTGAELAKNFPDQYVWEKFAEFFSYADESKRVVEWETWINESDIYDPPCDSIREWPDKLRARKFGQTEFQTIMKDIKMAHGDMATTNFELLTLNFSNPYYEEVRFNRPMFEYINKHKLYLKPNVNKMAKERSINFPSETAIVKTQWKKISENEKDRYYWQIMTLDSAVGYGGPLESSVKITRLMGMAAFHIVTKELPDYVWSTFEHVDNPGRCDFIGCTDSFGFQPQYVEPNKIDSLIYTEPAQMTAELEAVFAEYNIGDVFRNYRLKASQIKYVEENGDSTLAGNSVLEANLVATSSCISCHARATVNATTGKPLGMFVAGSGVGTFELEGSPNDSRGWHPVCFTGRPIEADYMPVDSVTGEVIADSIYYTTDFLWQLAQLAGSCDGTDNGSGN